MVHQAINSATLIKIIHTNHLFSFLRSLSPSLTLFFSPSLSLSLAFLPSLLSFYLTYFPSLTGVNFISILQASFAPTFWHQKLQSWNGTREKLLKSLSYKKRHVKCWWNWLQIIPSLPFLSPSFSLVDRVLIFAILHIVTTIHL